MSQVPDSVEQSIVQILSRGEGLGGISNGYIFTAAHCLDVDYKGGIALGEHRYQKCKTCDGQEFLADNLFVDAVSDLAVLRRPDPQVAIEQAEAYNQAVCGRGIDLYCREVPLWKDEPLAVRIRNKAGWVEGRAFSVGDGRVSIEAPTQIVGGASGGPVINVSTNELVAINSEYCETGKDCGGKQPWLAKALPVWLADELILIEENETDDA